MTTYAQFERRDARVCQDFGRDFFIRKFGQEAYDALPRYVRGKNKGLPKGKIFWEKCVRGGWVKTGRHTGEPGGYSGYVAGKGVSEVWYIADTYNDWDKLPHEADHYWRRERR